MSDNSIAKICSECLDVYRVYRHNRQRNQTKCPRCKAREQAANGRVRSIPVERTRLAQFSARIESLPPVRWERRPPKTSSADEYYRLEIRGSYLGPDWDDQITLFAPTPFQAGDEVFVRVMRAIHQVKVIRFSQGDSQRMAVLPVATTEADIPNLIASGKLSPAAEGYPLQVEYQVRDYVNLQPLLTAEPRAILRWEEDYPQELEDYEPALWKKSIAGGGRTAALVISQSQTVEDIEFDGFGGIEDEVLLGADALANLGENN